MNINTMDLIHSHPGLQKIRNQGIDMKIPMIESEGLIFLIKTIKDFKATRILEIGTAIGYSAIAIHLMTNAEVWTIERNLDLFNIACSNIESLDLSPNVHALLGDAMDQDLALYGKFDVIFIDAAKAQYQRFFSKFEHLLKDSGVIITDNLSFHGIVNSPSQNLTRNQRAIARKIRAFVDWLKEIPNYNTEFYSIGDGMSLSVRKRGN
jgi:predicted O-methyltransferase YrrM